MFKGTLQSSSEETIAIKDNDDKLSSKVLKLQDLATDVLDALGGKKNIINLDACITRLRISVNNIDAVDKKRIIALGAGEVLEIGNKIQALFGTTSNELKEQIKKIIYEDKTSKAEEIVKEEKEFIKEVNGEDLFVAPLSGKLLSLEYVPDDMFSKKLMGEGFAIDPADGEVVSPVNGKIETLFPTKHAIGIISENGHKILIHFGIDTVNLKGRGFKPLVKQGDIVKVGQPILSVNLIEVKAKATSIITPIIFTNLLQEEKLFFKMGLDVKAGQGQIINIK
ncbi:PTS sugar transporter subunit IIA [Paramaledivibacter caminithermalis]|jgi:PTS system D-glucosamine-specific IIC component|uniref:PTS system, glucose subfamily, IIA component n=1 Tax=Paramaledivibacter caminithermalis (strain DSM 15212 / CIP 107654 / DViRD3) TaxID=1121301 RepID=A0A1M6KUW4_PARC5|nr:PTS glucose transporter subunit IIA [Paramaledivibacter caminithermalis]SHJ62624.1 PTS system, glucose subfamily, IIA component [Paramaledivibacter caminithermalis DSM 15212]